MGLLKHVPGIKLQLISKGYDHSNYNSRRAVKIFRTNGTYRIEAQIDYYDENKAIFPEMNISCTCDGPKSLARSKKIQYQLQYLT